MHTHINTRSGKWDVFTGIPQASLSHRAQRDIIQGNPPYHPRNVNAVHTSRYKSNRTEQKANKRPNNTAHYCTSRER